MKNAPSGKGIGAVMGYGSSLSLGVGWGKLTRPETDVSILLHWLSVKDEEYLDEQDRQFTNEVKRKRVKPGLEAS